MIVVGLTGGIGAGKTTVAKLFSKHDIPIIDADVVARDITKPGDPAYQRIVKHFGNDVLLSNGTLDRAKLRNIIFADSNKRHWLEKLMHPLIREAMKAQVERLSALYCIAVIPLLLEAEFYSFINRILVVDAPEEAQILRVTARDHVPITHVESILKSQATRKDRLARAQDVITNASDPDDLIEQVNQLHAKYIALSQKSTT